LGRTADYRRVPELGPTRCSACGARLAAAAAWCSLCLTPAGGGSGVGSAGNRAGRVPAPILPAAVSAVARSAAAPAGPPPAPEPAATPSPGRRGGRHRKPVRTDVWPCVRCGTGVDWTADSCPSCGATFLAGVEAPLDAGRLRPWVAAATSATRRTRVVALAGLALAVTLIGLALLTAVGALLA
jgi:hypothetical protein